MVPSFYSHPIYIRQEITQAQKHIKAPAIALLRDLDTLHVYAVGQTRRRFAADFHLKMVRVIMGNDEANIQPGYMTAKGVLIVGKQCLCVYTSTELVGQPPKPFDDFSKSAALLRSFYQSISAREKRIFPIPL